MWEDCLKARIALSKVYEQPASYDTHSPLSPNVISTSDIFYKEQIRFGQIYNDDKYEVEMRSLHHDWLRKQGRANEITPPASPPWIEDEWSDPWIYPQEQIMEIDWLVPDVEPLQQINPQNQNQDPDDFEQQWEDIKASLLNDTDEDTE